MGTGVRPRKAWAMAVGVAMAISVGVVGAPSASAGSSTAQFCTINISTGEYACSSVDPDLAGRLAPALDGGSTVLLARFYDDVDRDPTDGYFNVTAAAACDTSSDLDFSLGTVPSGWNDRVSSFQGYNNCQIKLWTNGNMSGTSWGPASYADTVGALNNQSSSMTFY